MVWHDYIRDDLKARIHRGHELPGKLTLQTLSDRYNVSLTPVRAAVEELVAERYLHKRPNGRLAINARKIGNGGSEPELPEPPSDPAGRITEDLVLLSARGEAVFLREEQASQRYGITRAAVRHTFNRLAGRGLLEHLPRRGWRLRPLRQEDLSAYIDARAVLELKALDLAWPLLEEHRLREMLAGNAAPASSRAPVKIDNSLHAYIIDKADNFYIRDFFDRHGRYYTILFDWESLDRRAAMEEAQQHRDILESILAADKQAAAAALDFHIRNNHPVLTDMLLKQRQRSNGHTNLKTLSA